MYKRLKEPSSYAGLAAIFIGLGQMFDIDEAPVVAQAVEAAAPAFITGNWVGGLITLLGAGAIIMKEKGDK